MLEDATLRCWGYGSGGENGYLEDDIIGDFETPAMVGPVPVGGNVVAITRASGSTCALLDTLAIRCWGWPHALGYGDGMSVGLEITPAEAGDVPVW